MDKDKIKRKVKVKDTILDNYNNNLTDILLIFARIKQKMGLSFLSYENDY